ncbi:MAG: CPBP family intramembrane metalloprotease [Clostridiales bacterium]|nr:CPBP family intramembrane metalloprotease [Candidatus Apopatousia equi]
MEKRLDYNKKDSANIFIMSIIIPILIVSTILAFIKIIFPNISNTVYSYLSLSLNQVALFFIFFIYNKLINVNMIKANKVKFNLNIYQIVIIIAIGIVALYGFSPLVNYFDYLIRQVAGTQETFSFLDLSSPLMFIVNVILIAGLPAICEELIFRGVVLNGLKKYGVSLMIVLSGLLFSIMHMSLEQSIYQFVLGMALACIVMITGSIVSSMILHFFNNFYILFTNFVFKQTETTLWSPQNAFDHIYPFLIAIATVAVVFALLLLLKKCTKNPEYDLFNFKKFAKKEQSENIDIITEANVNATSTEVIVPTEQETAVINKKNFFSDDGNIRVVIAFAVGIIVWLSEVLLTILG